MPSCHSGKGKKGEGSALSAYSVLDLRKKTSTGEGKGSGPSSYAIFNKEEKMKRLLSVRGMQGGWKREREVLSARRNPGEGWGPDGVHLGGYFEKRKKEGFFCFPFRRNKEMLANIQPW